MAEVKWGIIGSGSIAREFVKDLIYITETSHQVTAFVGHDKNRAEAFQRDLHVKSVYYSVADLVKNEDLDAVYIATPHPLHYDAALEVLDAKIPVLCEKPLAINQKQVKEIITCAHSNNTFLLEGIWTRFLPSFIQILDLINMGAIGEINSIEASLSYLAKYDPNGRYFNPSLGGGSLLDLGVYPVFLTHMLLGKPKNIVAYAHLGPTKIDHACSVILSYENGAYANLESSLTKQSPTKATIFGEKGMIQISPPWTERPDEITVILYDGSTTSYYPNWSGKGLYFEAKEVIDCLKKKKSESAHLPHQTSLEISQVLDEIRAQTHINYPDFE